MNDYKKIKDKRLMSVNKMPPLFHKIPGKEYETRSSEVINWIVKQPQILEYLLTIIVRSGLIQFDNDTKKWQGVAYKSKNRKEKI